MVKNNFNDVPEESANFSYIYFEHKGHVPEEMAIKVKASDERNQFILRGFHIICHGKLNSA